MDLEALEAASPQICHTPGRWDDAMGRKGQENEGSTAAESMDFALSITVI